MRLLLIFLLAAVHALAQELPRAAAELGAFALPNESGTQLIAVGGMPGAASATKALCTGGILFPVRFEGKQSRRKDDDGRQTPSRFDRLAGDVFQVVRGRVAATSSCFLVGAGWISGANLIPMRSAGKDAACEGSATAQIAASKGRAIVKCMLLGRLDGNGQVVLAEFERRGADALASVALLKGSRVLLGDYPAEFREEGADLWRVDDGGVLSAEGFHVMFVLRRGERFVLGVSWAGTEGRSLEIFVSGKDSTFTRFLEDYWYQVPE